MSRTYKDKPFRFTDEGLEPKDYTRIAYEVEQICSYTYDEVSKRYKYTPLKTPIYYTGFYTLYTKTTKPKRRRQEDITSRWYKRTPSAWTRLMMNRPMRAKGRAWERKVLLEDINETDPPSVSRKPHIYYW